MDKYEKFKNKGKQMIHYRHVRRYTESSRLVATGGTTYAIEQDGENFKVGIAECSKRDSYCKKTGRELAASRLAQTKLPRDTINKVLIDKTYFKPLTREGHANMIIALPTEAIAITTIFEILQMLKES